MHDGMPYGPIQGQGQGHDCFESHSRGVDRQSRTGLIMAALCNRGALYFCHVVSFYLSIFFFSSPNLSGHRLHVYRTSTHGVALARI